MLLKIGESLLIGISIAAIPGPIFFELIRRTLFKGLAAGIALVIGEFIGNFLLLSIIYNGADHYFKKKIIKILLYIIGGGVLVFISYFAFKLKPKIIDEAYKESPEEISKHSFIAGLSIAATSPIVITLWLSLSGSYLTSIHNQIYVYTNIVCIAAGFLLFFIPLALIVHKTRHIIAASHVLVLSRIFGVILLGFSVLLYINALRLVAH